MTVTTISVSITTLQSWASNRPWNFWRLRKEFELRQLYPHCPAHARWTQPKMHPFTHQKRFEKERSIWTELLETTKELPKTGLVAECSPHSQAKCYKVRDALHRNCPPRLDARTPIICKLLLCPAVAIHLNRFRWIRCGCTILRLGSRLREQTAK